jgi:hypothetical protein
MERALSSSASLSVNMSRRVVLPRCGGRRLGAVIAAVGALVCLGLVWRSLGRSAPGVIATSSAGRPLRWTQAEIVLRPNAGADEAFNAMLRKSFVESAKAWNDALAACRAPKLRVARSASRALRPIRDGFSTVLVRRDKWCPDAAHDESDCYGADRAAFTSLYPNDAEGGRYGDLREADLELNGVDFSWSLEGENPGTNSLHAIVVHELGHVLGLEHPCEVLVRPPGAARVKPRCDSAALRASIMYPLPLEVGRRAVLEPGRGEIDALCALYTQSSPAGATPAGSP